MHFAFTLFGRAASRNSITGTVLFASLKKMICVLGISLYYFASLLSWQAFRDIAEPMAVSVLYFSRIRLLSKAFCDNLTVVVDKVSHLVVQYVVG